MKRRQVKAKRPQCTPKVTKREAFGTRFSLSLKPVFFLLLIALPVVAVLGAYKWIQNPENLTIKSIEVTGDFTILDKAELSPLIESYVKTNLFLLDDKNLEKAIENNPWVHSASLTHVWPNKLIVKIYEQKPVAHWGKTEMLAENGEIEGSVHLPRGVLEFYIDPASAMHMNLFSSDKTIIFYCETGGRSLLAAKLAKDMGVINPVYMDGGFSAWQAPPAGTLQ